MNLTHNNRVFFDPISHNYLLDNETILIGVTSLMRKHGLSPDYSDIPANTLKQAAIIGTEIHKEIQDYENGLTVFNSELIDNYKKLCLKFIESEYPVSDFRTVASAIDLVCEGKSPNSVILIDIKTTAKYHRRSLEWQLSIYRTLFERQNPGITVEGLYCLHIDKKSRKILGLIPVEPVSEEEVDALLDAERKGLPYFDEKAEHEALEAFSENELEQYTSAMEKVAQAKEIIKQAEVAIKAFEARVLDYMQENKIESLSADGGTFTIKKSYERTSIDAAKLRKDYPQLAEKYGKTTTVAASIIFKANS